MSELDLTAPPPNARAVEVNLRWTDFDSYGHVHTSGHMVLLENARSAFISSVLCPGGPRLEWVLLHVSLDFVAELPLEEERRAICRVGIVSYGRSSLVTWEAVESVSGRIVSRANCVIALWDPAAHSTRPLSAEERASLVALGVPQRPISGAVSARLVPGYGLRPDPPPGGCH